MQMDLLFHQSVGETLFIPAPIKPSNINAAAMCIVCFLYFSFNASQPSIITGTPKKAGINAVILSLLIPKYAIKPRRVKSIPNVIAVLAILLNLLLPSSRSGELSMKYRLDVCQISIYRSSAT